MNAPAPRSHRPRLGALLALVTAVLVADALLVGTAAAAGPARAALLRSASDQPAAVALLRGAVAAGERTSWTGTQFGTVWTDGHTTAVMASARHAAGGATTYRVMGGDGSPVGMATVGMVDDVADDRFVDLMVAAYDVRLAGSGSVAGRSAAVVDLRRSDGTLAGRVWADEGCGLLLRREVYDAEGNLVRAGGFLDLDVEPAAPASAPSPSSSSRATRPAQPSDGPELPTRLGDLVLYDVSRSRMHGETVTHLLYGDGLSSASLFYQRGRLDPADLDGFTRREVAGTAVWVADEPPVRVTWDCSGWVYTVVADASGTTMTTMLTALPLEAAADEEPTGSGLGARLSRGLDRVGGWLNPFG